MREFDTGATRDTDVGKNDYEGFFSPLVVKRFGDYMTKHRKQADGKLRSADNWQKGIPKDAYIKSAWRHFLDWWMEHRNIPSREGLEDALCALMFNIMGYLYEVLKNKQEDPRTWIEKGVCKVMEKELGIMCNLGYACDACPYNKGDK